MKMHELKIEQHWYDRLVTGEKTHELRFNDKDYQVGDVLLFKLPHGEAYPEQFGITHILHCYQFSQGLKDGYCILSLERLQDQ
jgi:hypothetical protein